MNFFFINFSKHTFLRCFLLIALTCVFAFNIGNNRVSAAQANSTESIYLPIHNTKVLELKKLLSDPNVQQWLEDVTVQPNTQRTTETNTSGFRENLSLVIEQIRTRKEHLLIAWQQSAQAPSTIISGWQSQMSNSQSLRAITYILIFLFVGAGFEWLFAQYTGPRLLSLELQKPDNLRQKVSTASLRALFTFGGLVFFAIGSIGVFLSFEWLPLTAYLVLEILIVILLVRFGIAIFRFFLAPRLKELRLVPLSNAEAKAIYFWAGIIIFLTALNSALANIFTQLFDALPVLDILAVDVLSYSALAINTINNFALLLLALLATYRLYVIFSTKTESTTTANQQTPHNKAKFWALYFAALLAISYLLWLIDIQIAMKSLVVLGLLIPSSRLFATWINYLFDQATHQSDYSNNAPLAYSDQPPADELELNEQNSNAGNHPYENYRLITRRLTRFILIVVAILSLMIIWGYNPFSLSSASTMTGKIFQITIDVLAAILIADLIWVWARTYIDKRLADYRPPEDGHAPGPEARMATLLPLLRTILIVTLFSMVTFSVLASLGFNIGPLLAGAGVIGLAIGFGAQTLVKDVVSGIFYLIDDAFRVGEYIEIGDLRGTVESISIRSLRVRHHRGAVHTIPFGELKSITNHSRDWVIMKLEFRIPFDTNMQQVKKLIKKIGVELLNNPDFGHSFIEPLKSQGVRRMEEFNMVLGVKFMTRPGEQWVIRREAYHKIRDTFEANGIGLAERNVKVQVLSDGEPLNEKTKQAIVGAAHNAIEPQAPKGPIPDEP
ncbi:MAG: mechanosensitive ion channel family protein [Oceanospirillaceae bacterium]